MGILLICALPQTNVDVQSNGAENGLVWGSCSSALDYRTKTSKPIWTGWVWFEDPVCLRSIIQTNVEIYVVKGLALAWDPVHMQSSIQENVETYFGKGLALVWDPVHPHSPKREALKFGLGRVRPCLVVPFIRAYLYKDVQVHFRKSLGHWRVLFMRALLYNKTLK